VRDRQVNCFGKLICLDLESKSQFLWEVGGVSLSLSLLLSGFGLLSSLYFDFSSFQMCFVQVLEYDSLGLV
jgi:hypothetical protein